MTSGNELTDENEIETDDNMERSVYLAERDLLIKGEHEAASSFDKTIVTLSAGALALSLTFVKQIATHIDKETINFLAMAWFGFGSSLMSILFSFLTSQSAYRKQRDILDDIYEGKTENSRNHYKELTKILSDCSIILFIFGCIELSIFCYFNL